MKTTNEIKAQKNARLKTIIEAINKQPCTLSEIEKIVFHNKINEIGRRTLFNYLEELKALGIIEYDNESKLYVPKGVIKQVFSSKTDYELALNHSKKLIENSSTIYSYPFEYYIPDKYLDSHFQTGYSEIWEIIEKYRDLITKYRLLPKKSLPHKGFPALMDAKPQTRSPDRVLLSEEEERLDPSMPEGDKRILEDLKNTLSKEILFIRAQLDHGTPLNGYCDLCPNRKVIIKDD